VEREIRFSGEWWREQKPAPATRQREQANQVVPCSPVTAQPIDESSHKVHFIPEDQKTVSMVLWQQNCIEIDRTPL